VAHTKGIAPAALQILEALSSYKSLYAVHEEQQADNPISYSHYSSNLLGRSVSVLSRVSPSPADHTGRSNKLAHHVLLHAREYPVGGPLWLSQQPGFFLDNWKEEAHLLELPKSIPVGDSTGGKAETWEQVTGDAGNAALLATLFQKTPKAQVYLVFSPGMSTLSLLGEALALLPPASRWQVTYNTYFTSLPVGVNCLWRCCVPEAEILREARRNPQAQIFDLTGKLPPLEENKLVELARNGRPAQPVPASEAAERVAVPPKKKKFMLLPQRSVNMLNLKPRKRED